MKKLQSERRWCLWRLEPRKDKPDKMQKSPYQPNGRHAMVNNRQTWSTYNTVVTVHANNPGKYNGIGLFFSNGLCGIDVDGDHNVNGGEHNPLEAEVLALFAGTYAEKSPSGTGVHIVFRADPNRIPTKIVKDKKTGEDKLDLDGFHKKNERNGLEFYAGGLTNRYFTFTGNCISASDEVTDQTEALLTFLNKYMKDDTQTCVQGRKRTVSVHSGVCAGGDPDIDARLNLARNAANGEKFRRLYDLGDVSQYNGGDDSAADLALCSMLGFYLDGDPEAIDAAFRRSKLYRAKWDEQHGIDTYGGLTITKALDGLTDVYHAPRFRYRPTNSVDLTDAGNAEVFSALYGGRVRWCDALGWLVWDGRVWNVDEHAVEAMALEFSNEMLIEAFKAVQESTVTDENGSTSTDAGAKAYLQHARKTRSAAGIRNMLTLLKAWVSIPAKDLDADAYTLNTAAGLIDLHTGEIRPHDPDAHCTKIVPFSPSADGAEKWEQFLDLVTVGDSELKAYLRRVAGMSIVGAVKSETVQIAYGGGRNGKSTYFSALQNVLDSYAGSLDADVLTTDKKNKGAAMATLRGQRLVVCGELEEGQRLSIKELKRLAATDKLVIEQKYKDPETIRPSHHLTMFTNFLPRVGSTDVGTWRRLTVIPFNATMPTGNAEIPDYAEVLTREAGGAILQWMLDGAAEYLGNGCKLNPPAAVKAATNEYQGREDWLMPFISECCTRDAGAKEAAGTLYQAYKQWATMRGEPFIHRGNEFREGMERLGFENVNHSNRSVWKGLRLMPCDGPGEGEY